MIWCMIITHTMIIPVPGNGFNNIIRRVRDLQRLTKMSEEVKILGMRWNCNKLFQLKTAVENKDWSTVFDMLDKDSNGDVSVRLKI